MKDFNIFSKPALIVDDWAELESHGDEPTNNLFERFGEGTPFAEFFIALYEKGIKDTDDLKLHTSQELFDICPLNWFKKQLFLHYVKSGLIVTKDSPFLKTPENNPPEQSTLAP